MQSQDVSVINQALEWGQSVPIWLCTVLATYGSSPRESGCMLVARASGQYCGSLSGGCVEEDFIEQIKQGEYTAASQVIYYGRDGIQSEQRLPCGGQLVILIEYLEPNSSSCTYLSAIQSAMQKYCAFTKVVTLPHPAYLQDPLQQYSSTYIERDGDTIKLHLAPPAQLFVAGLSNVAIYCANFASTLGFKVIICEHREQQVNYFTNQLTDDIELITLFPARYLEDVGCTKNTAIVALTHDPRIDDLTLMEAVNTPAFYIGAMGSKQTSYHRRQRLLTLASINVSELTRIHAPIGLPIGSKTPAEIALAIMADIVAHKNGINLTE